MDVFTNMHKCPPAHNVHACSYHGNFMKLFFSIINIRYILKVPSQPSGQVLLAPILGAQKLTFGTVPPKHST